MTIGNAKKFIDQAQVDDDLRRTLNGAETFTELTDRLETLGMTFSAFDFEEAFNNKLVSCQFQEQADQLQELKMWWQMLHSYLGAGEVLSCASSGSCGSSGGCGSCGG
ncbi:MAG: hypothetical protein JXX29_04025 [Deltaproteobacteria bacterium]|nr:hypothetical protein [Deltaproteobacteria bacterium]MBN2670812.1 hypothetical protein [Deltaproteobacteria bacterium]